MQPFLMHFNIHNTKFCHFLSLCSERKLDYKHLNQITCYSDEQPCSVQHSICPFPSMHIIILPVSSCFLGQSQLKDANLYYGLSGIGHLLPLSSNSYTESTKSEAPSPCTTYDSENSYFWLTSGVTVPAGPCL